MARRRVGDRNQFWNNAATGANGVSSAVEVSRGVDNFCLYVTVNGATTVSVEVAHKGDLTSEGLEPDAADGVWHKLYRDGNPVQIVFGAADSIALQMPDFVASHIRLRSTGAVTATAGWEGVIAD